MKLFSADWWLEYVGISFSLRNPKKQSLTSFVKSIEKSKEIKDRNMEYSLPGLSQEEARYFHYTLSRPFSVIRFEEWTNLSKLNQKMLSSKEYGL